jgi:Ca-activated chloride channel family protein
VKSTKHIIFCLLLFPLFTAAQPFYTKGRVKDQEGRPLQNVTLLLHSSGYLYQTGKDGDFGVLIPAKTDTVTLIRQGYEKEKSVIYSDSFNILVFKKAAVAKVASPNHLLSQVQNLSSDDLQLRLTGDETYASIVENDFVGAGSNPTTGITLNVDRASYSNVRRFLNLQSRVPTDAVRIEEMLNYFNLSYNQPPEGQTFAINTTLTSCPWNKKNALLFAQVNSKKLELDHLPQTHLVFLIDISGSMDLPNRLSLLKTGFKSLVHNLRPIDTVSIVVYGGTVGVALFPTSGGEKERILQVIDSLQPGGATPGESGIKLAYSLAREHFIAGGNNRVILATDGDFNVGLRKEEELEELILRQRLLGVYLTCLGVGMGNYKDSKIQLLAQRGNGNFAYLDSPAEVEKVLLKEFTQTMYTVADDAFLTANFNPQYVSSYRLIGFENKAGAVRDSTAHLEGGEVGSAYSMLVAFEIVPATNLEKEPTEPVQFVLRYKNSGSDTLCEIAEQPQVIFTPFDQLSKPLQFASAVMWFGSLLRASKYVKNNSWSDITTLAKPAADTGNYSQMEFLSLVENAKRLYKKRRKFP